MIERGWGGGRRGAAGDKCYCGVNVKHLSISGAEAGEIEITDGDRGSSVGGEKVSGHTGVEAGWGVQHLAAA